MSETISLEFIGRRVDSVQNDVRDLRLRVVTIGDGITGLETRLTAIEVVSVRSKTAWPH